MLCVYPRGRSHTIRGSSKYSVCSLSPARPNIQTQKIGAKVVYLASSYLSASDL